MATKTFALDSIGTVTITKRSGNRHLRLSVAPSGKIRVSIPTWAPYKAGIDFAIAKQPWITAQLPAAFKLEPLQAIGRSHTLVFKPVNTSVRPKTQLSTSEVIISYPRSWSYLDPRVQSAAESAAIRALRKQAQSILPERTALLAKAYRLPYHELRIKRLSRRWGSCDSKKSIVLNLFLVQLPDELIDYVILHELTHTRHLNHGPKFWQALETISPEARRLKKMLHSYHPGLLSLSNKAI